MAIVERRYARLSPVLTPLLSEDALLIEDAAAPAKGVLTACCADTLLAGAAGGTDGDARGAALFEIGSVRSLSESMPADKAGQAICNAARQMAP